MTYLLEYGKHFLEYHRLSWTHKASQCFVTRALDSLSLNLWSLPPILLSFLEAACSICLCVC